LQEVSVLRAEVRSLAAACSEIFDIRDSVLCMQNTTSAASAVNSHTERYQGPSTASNLPAQSVSNTVVEDPADDAVAADQHFNDVASDDVGVKEGVLSFSQVARKLKSTGMTEKSRSKNTLKPIVGVSTSNSKIKSVGRKRSVDVFVTRLDSETDCSEVKSCVSDMLNISYDYISCEKLTPKFKNVYASFHVSVKVTGPDLQQVVSPLMDPTSWPSGVLVRRYFLPKNG